MIDRSLNWGRKEILSFFEEIAPYETVLDIGAGHGDDLRGARVHRALSELHGVDIYEPNACELESQGIHVHRLDIERDQLPFGDESIDVVLANQILEHTKEVFWITHEMSRVLKVGGHLIIGVPNLAALHNRILLLIGRQPSQIKTNSAHVRGFTKGDVRAFLESGFPYGYHLKRFKGSNFYPFPPVLAMPLAEVFPSMAWGNFFLFKKINTYKDGFLRFPVDEKLETNFYLGR